MSDDHERESEIARLRGEESELEKEIEALKGQLAELEEGGFGYFLIESVYAVILCVSIGAWTILGFAVWLPLLVRTTTLLAGSVFYHSLFRDQPRVMHAQRSVNFAVRFYVKGFAHFIVFYRERHKPDPPVGLFEPLTAMKWRELLVECAWVVGVWAVTYFVVHSLVVALFRT